MIKDDIILLLLSIFNLSIIAYVYHNYELEILEKSYSVIVAFGILLLITKIIFNVNLPFIIIIHYIYALSILFAPFLLSNNILLYMSLINVILLLLTRVVFKKCILTKHDGINELPFLFNVDRVGFIFLILIILRILKVF